MFKSPLALFAAILSILGLGEWAERHIPNLSDDAVLADKGEGGGGNMKGCDIIKGRFRT